MFWYYFEYHVGGGIGKFWNTFESRSTSILFYEKYYNFYCYWCQPARIMFNKYWIKVICDSHYSAYTSIINQNNWFLKTGTRVSVLMEIWNFEFYCLFGLPSISLATAGWILCYLLQASCAGAYNFYCEYFIYCVYMHRSASSLQLMLSGKYSLYFAATPSSVSFIRTMSYTYEMVMCQKLQIQSQNFHHMWTWKGYLNTWTLFYILIYMHYKPTLE